MEYFLEKNMILKTEKIIFLFNIVDGHNAIC